MEKSTHSQPPTTRSSSRISALEKSYADTEMNSNKDLMNSQLMNVNDFDTKSQSNVFCNDALTKKQIEQIEMFEHANVEMPVAKEETVLSSTTFDDAKSKTSIVLSLGSENVEFENEGSENVEPENETEDVNVSEGSRSNATPHGIANDEQPMSSQSEATNLQQLESGKVSAEPSNHSSQAESFTSDATSVGPLPEFRVSGIWFSFFFFMRNLLNC